MLAGWKSADGQLHDYWFTFVQGVAITYGLLDDKTANAVMDRLLAKMQAVGYTNFALGLPGNLVPVKKGDYVHEHDSRRRCTGVPRLDDGSDGFQFYENGGATGCWAYYTVKALFQLGRVRGRAADLPPDAGRLRARRVPGLRRQRHVARLARLEGRLPRLRRPAGGQLPHAAGRARRRGGATTK